ncbi:Chaperone protein dnaJ 72 [Nymphaea thermarum]|nr:Chaperone protein dnaJ 72 [Nymphaea thermarum]
MMADHYVELEVGPNASSEEIRSAYRKQAVRWHPDKWGRVPLEVAEEAKKKFQRIQEAYSVLSDGRKRTLYDAGLYDPTEEVDEELFALMSEVRNEKRSYGLGELQSMLMEMMDVQDPCDDEWVSASRGRRAKRARGGGHGCRDAVGGRSRATMKIATV